MNIASKLLDIKSKLPLSVTLVAVSKTHPESVVLEAYQAGHRIFGENRVPELCTKAANLPNDIEWHFIGHLQTNKVKAIAPFIHTIQSVDSLHLLKEINKEAKKCNRVINCLLEMYVAEEETKYGLSIEEATELLNSPEYASMQNISITGIMGMATYTCDEDQIRNEFKQLHNYFIEIKGKWFSSNESFKELSMGMSGDYNLAIEQGSTMVRIGSSIFGFRTYN